MTNEQYQLIQRITYKYATGIQYKDDIVQELAIKLLRQDNSKLTAQYITVAVKNYIKDLNVKHYEDLDTIEDKPIEDSILCRILGYLTDSEQEIVELYLETGSYRKMAEKWQFSRYIYQQKMEEIINKLKQYTNEINY